MREDQPRARRGTDSRRRQARGRDRAAADRPLRPRRARARGGRSGRGVSRRHARSRQPCASSRGRRGTPRRSARAHREADPGRGGSRRRQLRCRDCAPARERGARRAAAREALHRVAARVGADVPFFLGEGTLLGVGDGTELTPVAVPVDYTIALVLPHGQAKASTAAVYQAFDGAAGGVRLRRAASGAARGAGGSTGRAPISRACHETTSPRHRSPPSSRNAGALRADVTGAGPAVYGLFERVDVAESALTALENLGRSWVRGPCRTDAPGRGGKMAHSPWGVAKW